MTQPYPLPRETRSSGVNSCDGLSATFGPFSFMIFDIEDVTVEVRHDGETFFSPTSAVTITKTADAAYDTFSITFDTVHPATSEYIVYGDRTAERSLAITKGTSLKTDELEKELSKTALTLQEIRRDLDRALLLDHGTQIGRIEVPAAGNFLIADADGNLIDGGPAGEIANASFYAQQAIDAATAAGTAQDAAEGARDTVLNLTTAYTQGLLQAANDAAARSTLGLGSIATQAADAVNLDGGTMDGVVVGAEAAASAKVTDLDTDGTVVHDFSADGHSVNRVRARRSGSNFNSAATIYDAPRSTTGDGGYQAGRGMILAQGNSTGTDGSLWLFAASASLAASSDRATLEAYQSGLEVNSGGKLRAWKTGNEYFRVEENFLWMFDGADFLRLETILNAAALIYSNTDGDAGISLDPLCGSSSDGFMTAFRNTNTSGDVRARFYRGDGTANYPIAQISREYNNYICALDGGGGAAAKEGPHFAIGAEGSINQYKLLLSRIDFDTTDLDAIKNHLLEIAADGDHGNFLGPIVDLMRGGNDSNILTTDVNAAGANQAIGALRYTGRTADSSAVRYAGLEAVIVSAANATYQGQLLFRTAINGVYNTRATLENGLKLGTPAGGDTGYGTLNALSVYDDNTLLCAPIEEALTGSYDPDEWAEIARHDGLQVYEGYKAGGFVPTSARSFVDLLEEFQTVPGQWTKAEQANDNFRPSNAHRHERVLLSLDLMALALRDLNTRLEALEAA